MNDSVNQRSARLLAALQARGYRVTEPRRAVADALAEGGQHLSHADIMTRAQSRYPDIGQATIYRTLDLLVSLGLIHATYQGDANQRFVLPQGGHHHHLICNQCGASQELDECHFGTALLTISQQTGFAIESHLVELYGRCNDCRAAALG